MSRPSFYMIFLLSFFLLLPLVAKSFDPFAERDLVIDGNQFGTPQKPDSQIQDPKLPTPEEPTSEEPIKGVVCVSSTLRLRAWPWGPVISSHGNGTQVEVIGTSGEFYEVKINGVLGYLHKNYVSIPGTPASGVDPYYPGDTKNGGYIAPPPDLKKEKIHTNPTPTNVAAASTLTAPSVPSKISTTSAQAMPVGNLYNPSVIGKSAGDGTPAGALTWAADQMPGGKQKGRNNNNGKISKNVTAWNSWCLAFVATAYGRKIPQLNAPSAIASYRNFKNAGMIHTDKNPPPGAVMFTGTTSTNPYGHIFIATGKKTSSGEPIVVSSGGSRRSGIFELTLSQMIGSLTYLGWALPN